KGGSDKTLQQVEDIAQNTYDVLTSIYDIPDVEEYTISNFTPTYGYEGTTIGNNLIPISDPTVYNIILDLPNGNYDLIEVSTIGGSARRRWYFVDDDFKIISLGQANGASGSPTFSETLTPPPLATKFIAQAYTLN